MTLKIITNEGIYGLGDATLNGRELSVVSYLEDHVIPCLIGRDPHQIEDIWQFLYRGAYWRRAHYDVGNSCCGHCTVGYQGKGSGFAAIPNAGWKKQNRGDGLWSC